MSKQGHPLRKLRFNFESDAWHGRASETLWVEAVGNGKYRLRNSPFFAKGLSFQDIVIAREEDQELIYVSTMVSSGHSTYRATLRDGGSRPLFDKYWEPLQKLGCTFESASPAINLISIDVPPSADIRAVYRLLETGESDQVWEFEEGHCAHPV
jgi:hypothetical protein